MPTKYGEPHSLLLYKAIVNGANPIHPFWTKQCQQNGESHICHFCRKQCQQNTESDIHHLCTKKCQQNVKSHIHHLCTKLLIKVKYGSVFYMGTDVYWWQLKLYMVRDKSISTQPGGNVGKISLGGRNFIFQSNR